MISKKERKLLFETALELGFVVFKFDKPKKNRRYSKRYLSNKAIRLLKIPRDECSSCGSIEHIHIHHIDKNKENNERNNLEALCARCHMERHPELPNKLFICQQ